MKTGAKNPPRKFDAVHGFQHGFYFFCTPPNFSAMINILHLKPYTGGYGTEAKINKKKKKEKKKEKRKMSSVIPCPL